MDNGRQMPIEYFSREFEMKIMNEAHGSAPRKLDNPIEIYISGENWYLVELESVTLVTNRNFLEIVCSVTRDCASREKVRAAIALNLCVRSGRIVFS